MDRPVVITDKAARFDSFKNGEVLAGKKKGRLPAMGWNSWNAFGSGNTEALTKDMADKIVELGLDKLGYKYVVLDDGCYKPERAYGLLSNEEVKFPSGFKALADYIHGKDLKFGMYNDIGTNLCAGAAVGTCGHEIVDAKTYFDWDVDFEYDPTIESVTLFDLDNGEEEELEADYMENDCVRAMNGCIIFNENEFRKYR